MHLETQLHKVSWSVALIVAVVVAVLANDMP